MVGGKDSVDGRREEIVGEEGKIIPHIHNYAPFFVGHIHPPISFPHLQPPPLSANTIVRSPQSVWGADPIVVLRDDCEVLES